MPPRGGNYRFAPSQSPSLDHGLPAPRWATIYDVVLPGGPCGKTGNVPPTRGVSRAGDHHRYGGRLRFSLALVLAPLAMAGRASLHALVEAVSGVILAWYPLNESPTLRMERTRW